jgi:hypothetical protein
MNDPVSSPAPVEGGCLCGAVRYRARPANREGYYCHCRMCQLAFGNTRAAFINLPKADVEWTRGAPTRHASSKIALRGFCGQCGTPLSFEYLDSERMDLSVGSLDDPGAFRPTSHFAIETRVDSWHCDDGLPGERFDSSSRIVERWKQAYGESVEPGIEPARKGQGTQAM